MSALPEITFQVNLIDYSDIYSSGMVNDIDNVVNQLEKATVWIEGVPYALKHGDTFTLNGIAAMRVRDNYVGKTPKVIEIV